MAVCQLHYRRNCTVILDYLMDSHCELCVTVNQDMRLSWGSGMYIWSYKQGMSLRNLGTCGPIVKQNWRYIMSPSSLHNELNETFSSSKCTKDYAAPRLWRYNDIISLYQVQWWHYIVTFVQRHVGHKSYAWICCDLCGHYAFNRSLGTLSKACAYSC